jgi:hypothetical protein
VCLFLRCKIVIKGSRWGVNRYFCFDPIFLGRSALGLMIVRVRLAEKLAPVDCDPNSVVTVRPLDLVPPVPNHFLSQITVLFIEDSVFGAFVGIGLGEATVVRVPGTMHGLFVAGLTIMQDDERPANRLIIVAEKVHDIGPGQVHVRRSLSMELLYGLPFPESIRKMASKQKKFQRRPCPK